MAYCWTGSAFIPETDKLIERLKNDNKI